MNVASRPGFVSLLPRLFAPVLLVALGFLACSRTTTPQASEGENRQSSQPDVSRERARELGQPETAAESESKPAAEGQAKQPAIADPDKSYDWASDNGYKTAAAPSSPPAPRPAPRVSSGGGSSHWITFSSGIRHNAGCRYYQNSKGRSCEPNDGRACKVCGG